MILVLPSNTTLRRSQVAMWELSLRFLKEVKFHCHLAGAIWQHRSLSRSSQSSPSQDAGFSEWTLTRREMALIAGSVNRKPRQSPSGAQHPGQTKRCGPAKVICNGRSQGCGQDTPKLPTHVHCAGYRTSRASLCGEWATDQGPVPHLATQAEKAGLRVKAWTVVFHSTPLAVANPDSAITNCFGDTFVHALCPSAPKAREYALRLVRAISARSVHALELEAVGFYGYEHLSLHDKCGVVFDLFHHFLFSCCVCPHCAKTFESAGLDTNFLAARFRERLLAFFEGRVPPVQDAKHVQEELGRLLDEKIAAALLRVRSQCVLSLLQEIRETVPSTIDLTVSSGLSPFECGASFGADPKETLQAADRQLPVADW